jgi:hypothetical protein
MKKRINELTSVLQRQDFEVTEVRQRNHLVIKARHSTGTRACFTAGKTPGDHRALRNFEATVRRTARAIESRI